MNWEDFAKWGAKIADWGKSYHENIRELPVRSRSQPGDIAAQLPKTPPENGEAMDAIMADFDEIVMPGVTHWQHPNFFAYFPANATPPSMLADFLTSTIAPQCMLWQTSPAATEMETVMMDWLRQSIGLPSGFQGVIQDSASSATLAATLTMRERALAWKGNQQGLSGQPRLRIYASAEVHTSVDRAIWVSGIGQENLVRIPIKNGTLPHEQKGKYGGARVFLKPASAGTGVIAGGAVRAVLEAVGVHNVLSKSQGSSNPHNVVKATFDALLKLRSPEMIARQRGISLDKVFNG